MGRIRYCIFDLDGTLLNTISTIRYYLNKTLNDAGIEGVSEDECRVFVGDGARLLVTRALGSKGITDEGMIEALLAKYMKAYDDAPLYLTEPYPGVPDALEALSAAGIKLGVVSNKPDFATRSVVRSFFGDIFLGVRGGIDGVRLKPAPDAPLALLSEMGGVSEECAFIGDTSVDMKTAKNMSAALALGVGWGFRDSGELYENGADAVVSDGEQLVRYILDF